MKGSTDDQKVRTLLLEGARAGDQAAIDELFRRYRLRLEIPGQPARRGRRHANG